MVGLMVEQLVRRLAARMKDLRWDRSWETELEVSLDLLSLDLRWVNVMVDHWLGGTMALQW